MSTGICRWLFLLVSFSTWTQYTYSKEIRVVCYYTNWSVYRPGTAKFSPQNINPYLCTHLIYAFGGFTKENTLKPFDKYQDIEKGGYAKFTGLKTYNKNLKTLLAIGGWNEASSRFSPMAANAERRKELVKNAIKFLRQNHFDGLDLDWEYPSFREGGKPRDKDNYAKLVQELREEFERESEKTGRPRLLLTMAVPAGIEYINKGYDVPKLTKYLDWMNILSYDYHSAFEPAVNHHAPLFSLEEASEYNYDTELNIDYTIKHYLELGADPNKLVLGIPTYGRSYTLFNPDANEIGSPADGPGDMGDATRENGYLAYYEICDNIKSNDWTIVQPNDNAMGPYAYKENQWVGFDDESIARKKSKYVAENNLGGIMFWAIDNDDFRGTCHGRPYPLIEAAKEALIEAYGLTDDNLISPPSKPTKLKPRTRTRPKSSEHVEAKSTSSNLNRRRNRNKTKVKDESTQINTRSSPRRKESPRRIENTSTYSSLKVITPSYTTPAPPATPDQGGAFKCEDEGFFPHPKDCKKYFWCLSGPGELGIIAHQFTCPAGLYFNKGADSCDYTQNVLCNKKLSKPKTTTESSSDAVSSTTKKATTTAFTFPTSRSPPKITAATSRTTFRQTTTTEASYDEEYEYEDDDTGGGGKVDSEEDPKVIKELLDLIKKAGGIEELEKHLNIHDSGSPNVGFTTPSTRTKSIVEKFLSKTSRNSVSSNRKPYSTINRNSRGPQNEGLSTETEPRSKNKVERGKPSYTNILRQRAVSPKTADEEESDDEEETDPPKTSKKSNQPEYVNIRRNRFGGSSTTEEPVSNTKTYDRNKILGESDDEEEDKNISNKVTLLRHTTPQYVNIRRSRPTTEESPSTKYATMRREPTTEVTPEDSDSDNDLTTPRYITLRRSSTTEPTTTNNYSGTTLRYATVSTETTVKTADVTFPSRETSTRNNMSAGTKEPSLSEAITAIPVEEPTVIPKITASPYLSILNSDNTNNIRTSTLLDTTVVDSFSLSTTRTTEITTETQTTTPIERVRTSPLLLEPRPFSISPREPLLTTSKPFRRTTTQTAKVSESNKRLRNKVNDSEPVYYPRKIIYSRREDNKSSTNDVPQRNRGSSRFSDKFDHSNDINNSNTSFVRGRKRISTDKPLLSDENVEAESPSSKNNVNRKAFVGGTRRFRPRPTPSQQTPSPEVTDDKSSRPYTRFISRKRPNQFGNNPTRNTGLKDQINSNSDDVTRATDSLEPKEFSRATPRNRKVIRRFRSTTPTITFSESTRNYNRRGGYFTHTTLANEINDLFVDNLPDQDNNLEDTSNEEDENIKLSESNIRENSNVNNNNAIFDVKGSQKFNRNEHKLLGKSARTLNNKPTEPNVIVRTRKIIRKIRPTEKYVISSTTVTEATNVGSQNEDDSQIEVTRVNNTSTTESTHHGRTRKIIRRLRPTTSSSSSRFGTTVTISPTVPTDDSFRHTPNLSNYKETKDIRSSTPNSVNQSRIRNRFKSDSLTNKYSPNLFTIEHQEPKNVQENDEAGVQTVSPITLKPRNRFIIRHRATTPKPIEETEEPTTEEIRPSVTSRGTVKYFTNFETTTHSEVSDDLQSTIPQTEDNSITETFNEPVTTDDQTSEGVTITIPFTETESKPQITESVTDYSLITSKLADEENGQSTIPFVVTTEETTSIDTTEKEFVSTERSSTNEVTTSTTVGTVGSTEENSTEPAITGSIETTTLSHRRSTLRSFRTRPPYSGLKRLTVTETPSSTVGQIDLQQKTTNKRRRIYRPSSTTEKTNPPSNSRFRNPTAIKNRHLYRSSSTTEKTKYSTPEDDENEDDVSLVVADTEVETVTKHSKFRPASRFNKGFGPTKSNNTRKAPSRTKIFGRTTEANRPVEDLNGINKAAVLSRNKNLFSKKRKMNIPTYNAPHELFNEENSFTSSASTTLDTESSTEYLTTLNHVFAETESPLKSSTVANEKIQKNPGKQERIVEVNRIVEVHVKNEVSSEEPHPSLDKIGAINRVTVIKIVDGNATNDTEKDIAENEIGYEAVPTTIIQQHENKSQIVANQKEFDIPFMVPGLATIQEIIMNEKNFSTDNQTDSVRQDRKFEIYGESKVNRNKLPDVVREINFDGEADVIDGFSHIKIITPKPVYPTEASTIALEGLFTTEPSRNGDKITTESELLDTEHSRFVDIRVLKQDNVGRKFAGRSDHDDFVPIRVLPNEEGVALRARVVEVAPKDKDGIRIVPIQVAMARKIGDIPIVGLANLNDKISNTPFNTQLESGVS